MCILKLKKNNSTFSSNDTYKKINNLSSYVDETLISFEGNKLEIDFLLLITEMEFVNDKKITDEIQKIYEIIQVNDNISPSIKERVKYIHEFYKYK